MQPISRITWRSTRVLSLLAAFVVVALGLVSIADGHPRGGASPGCADPDNHSALRAHPTRSICPTHLAQIPWAAPTSSSTVPPTGPPPAKSPG